MRWFLLCGDTRVRVSAETLQQRQSERAAGSQRLVSALLVKLAADRCFTGISVGLSHVHVEPRVSQATGLSCEEEERESGRVGGTGETGTYGRHLQGGRDGIMKGIKRRL